MWLNNVDFSDNSNGRSIILMSGKYSMASLWVQSCSYAHNTNGSLTVKIFTEKSSISLYGLMIVGNTGTFVDDENFISNSTVGQGVGIYIWSTCLYSNINISNCTIQGNSGGKSIVYITYETINILNLVSLVASSFTNNVGSALLATGCNMELKGHMVFMNNSAGRGAAMYLNQGSYITVKEYSTVEFIGNTASHQGGAIYIELPSNCPQHGIVFTDSSNISTVSFANNSARVAGNSIYFSIPASCNVVRDANNNNSLVNIPYKFNYTQQPGSIRSPITTSPYKLDLCSTSCGNRSNCNMPSRVMSGQPVGINATVYGYYGNVSETVQFLITCTNCNNTYRQSSNNILAHNGMFDVTMLAVDAGHDIISNTNVTLNLSSTISSKYRQLTGTVSIELSSCQSGYVFDPNLQRCVCYEQSKDIIQCQQDYAEIKYGYWFGIAVFPERTVSLCPIHYCKYEKQVETTNGYYKLPKELNDQCSSHRVGVGMRLLCRNNFGNNRL